MMLFKNLRAVARKHRRATIMTVVTLTVLLVGGGYGLWSVSVWDKYEASYQQWNKQLRIAVDNALALPATSAKERTAKLTAFKSVTRTIASAKESLCAVHSIFEWQHVIPVLKTREETCNQLVVRAGNFSERLQASISFLENEQTLAKIIASSTVSPAKLTEATWGSQTTTWQKAVDSIKKMSVDNTFNPVKSSAVESAETIEAAWQELIAAHTAKNKAKYLEAQTQLTHAYETLANVTSRSTEQFTTLINSLQAAYTEIFGAKAA